GHEWINQYHYTKHGDIDRVTSGPINGRHVTQCALSCNADPLAVAAGVVLNPQTGGVCVADPLGCIIVAAVLAAVLLGIALTGAMAHPIPPPPSLSGGVESSTHLPYNWVEKQTVDGLTIKVRKLTNREVSQLKTPWGRDFEKEKADQGYKANADIYVDQNGEYWIAAPGSKFITEFP
ncbi:MAG TPA: hypothetical protein VFV38_22955, partial [Ktedonobacteraceae bacterium]|nr:hypothetical protein [Ktedonobacteraceae bacterium]